MNQNQNRRWKSTVIIFVLAHYSRVFLNLRSPIAKFPINYRQRNISAIRTGTRLLR